MEPYIEYDQTDLCPFNWDFVDIPLTQVTELYLFLWKAAIIF